MKGKHYVCVLLQYLLNVSLEEQEGGTSYKILDIVYQRVNYIVLKYTSVSCYMSCW